MLSLVVIASGCAHTAGGDTESEASSTSVSIQNFSATQTEVFSDQPARLELTLINDGGATAEDTVARIFNVPFESDSGSNNNVWKLDGDRSISFGELQPADPENNLPAREHTQYWTLTSPNLEDGVTIPYQFMTEVYYKYQTRGTSSITLMSQQRFREEGNAARPTLDSTDGPIQLEVRTRSPIVFYPGDEGNRQTEMCVIVRNEGTGTPFLHSQAYDSGEYDVNEDSSNRVRLRVPDQGGIEFSPSDGSGNTAVVEILGNRGIQCFTINVDNWEDGLGPQQEVPIVLEADYGYSKETSASLTVQGSDRFGDSTDSSDGGDDGSSDSSDGSDSDDGGAADTNPGPGS